jgi:ankyrin repeat protein
MMKNGYYNNLIRSILDSNDIDELNKQLRKDEKLKYYNYYQLIRNTIDHDAFDILKYMSTKLNKYTFTKALSSKNNELFVKSILKDNIKFVEFLLQYGVKENSINSIGFGKINIMNNYKMAHLIDQYFPGHSGNINDMFVYNVYMNNIGVVNGMIKENIDVNVYNGQALITSCVYGNLEMIKTLNTLGKLDFSIRNYLAIKLSISKKNINIFNHFSNILDLSFMKEKMFKLTAGIGNIVFMKWIMVKYKFKDVNFDNSFAMDIACKNGYIEIVKFLLTCKNIQVTINSLHYAILNENYDIVECILKYRKLSVNQLNELYFNYYMNNNELNKIRIKFN